MVVETIPVSVTQILDIAAILNKKILAIQVAKERRFTLKHGCDMIKTHSKKNFFLLQNILLSFTAKTRYLYMVEQF